MLLTLTDVLDSPSLGHLRATVGEGRQPDTALIGDALLAHPLFLRAMEPRALSAPVFSRHERGTSSPSDVPDAMPCGRGGIRADAGVTVFLNDATEYGGGELIVDTGWGEEKIKEAAGVCVVYPASSRRGVAQITHGFRLTAELWVQSLVIDPRQREILYDIAYSASMLEIFRRDRTAASAALQRCHRNLLRMWAMP